MGLFGNIGRFFNPLIGGSGPTGSRSTSPHGFPQVGIPMMNGGGYGNMGGAAPGVPGSSVAMPMATPATPATPAVPGTTPAVPAAPGGKPLPYAHDTVTSTNTGAPATPAHPINVMQQIMQAFSGGNYDVNRLMQMIGRGG